MADANPTHIQGIVGIIVLAGMAWFYFGGGLENETARKMGEIEQTVATDSVTQYGIAKRNGNAMDACVHAGMVAAAFLQAKDEASYHQWKATETTDCKAAGLPQ